MKRQKVDFIREIIEETLDMRDAFPGSPVTIDTLEIDFQSRRVHFRGRTINAGTDYLNIPIIGTDRLILLNGEPVEMVK